MTSRAGYAYLARAATGGAHDHDWRHHARCRDADPELFFPVWTIGRPVEDQIQAAKAICELCPVREDCLQWALANREFEGIWGGLDENERRAMLRLPYRRNQAARPDAPHGTANRYTNGGCRCQPCTKAKAAAVARQRRRKREAS